MDTKSTAEYLGFRTALWVLRLLPYGCSRDGLRWVARTAGMRWGLRRDVVTGQLARIFADLTGEQVNALATAVFDHLGLTVAETFLADPVPLRESVVVDPGWAPVDEARKLGRGVIVATGHLGNFELGGRVLAEKYPLLDVIKPQRNVRFDRYLKRERARHGIRTVAGDRTGREVLRHLSRNGLVSLLLDQDAGKTGLRLPFLGQPASTWTGAAKISIRTGCPVLPMAILRAADGGHRLQIGQALHPEGRLETPQDIAAYAAGISATVESFIRRCPEQWFWVHRRWKGAEEARRTGESVT